MSGNEGSVSTRLPSEGGSSLGGWGGSSSGELDSWSWDEDEDDGSPPDGLHSVPALPRRRRSEDGLGRTARNLPLDGDYVELLEPRVGPDGGVDTKQRYLEMHGICKTKTLPLCRRGKAIKLRKGKAWGYGRPEGSGSFRAVIGAKRSPVTSNDEISLPQPQAGVTSSARGRQSYSSSVHDSDEGEKTHRNCLESHQLYFDSRLKERRPGVGKERDSNGHTQPSKDSHRGKDSESADSSVTNDLHDLTNILASHAVEGQSDHGSHSDSVFEDTDKQFSGESDATTPTSDAPERPLRGHLEDVGIENNGTKVQNLPNINVAEERDGGKTEDRVCPRGKEVKTAGFRAPRCVYFYTVINTLKFHAKFTLRLTIMLLIASQ